MDEKNIKKNINDSFDKLEDKTEEAVDAVGSRFDKVKSSLSGVEPSYIAVAAGAVVAIVGMIFVGRADKNVIKVDEATIIVDADPELTEEL